MANHADINLAALKRRDASIESILCASGHCILYNFDTARTKWVTTTTFTQSEAVLEDWKRYFAWLTQNMVSRKLIFAFEYTGFAHFQH